MTMITRKLGADSAAVSTGALGLGLMSMSGVYGPAEEAESLATIEQAVAAGMVFLDTGDFYGMGHNEMLLGRALKQLSIPRESVQLSVKFGAQRGPDGSWLGYDSRPAAVKTALAYTLNRLGVEYLDVYRPARLDPQVPIEETIGAISELIQAGYVRQVGLSEVGAETIRRAHAVHPITDLQIEYSLISRGIESSILPTTRELGIGITAYGVLARGLISGHWTADRSSAPEAGDSRGFSPRFQGEHLEHNLTLVEELRSVAEAKGVSVAQIAIAWVLTRGEDIVPLIGARTRTRLTEALGSLDVELTAADLEQIEKAVPKDAASGGRYPDAQLHVLDSEK
jgi:aryl-alcohol dehydrogenase-like predicted oxidoreductase